MLSISKPRSPYKDRGIKRRDPTNDPYNISLLISSMYQRTLNPSRKPYFFESNTSSLLFTNISKDDSETDPAVPALDIISDAEASNVTTSTANKKDTATEQRMVSIDSLLDQLESLSLEKEPSVKAKPTFMSQLSSQLIETKRLVLDTRNAIYDTLHDDYESLYAATAIPKPKAVKELTDEENQLVDSILRERQQGVVSQFKTAVVEFKDMYKLYPEKWLNDEVINFYMVLLMERSNTSDDLPSIHCYNTFFCSTLREQGFDKVKRWTKKVDIFQKHLLLIPINRSYHWTLGAVDMKRKQVVIYDSLNGKHHSPTIKLLLKYLEWEHMDKKKAPFDTSIWQGIHASDIPQQNNSSDCGVFTCTFAERLARNHPFDFSHQDINLIRRRMVLDIKQKKLSI